MTIKEQMKQIVEALNGWARERGGRAVAASGPVQVLELLQERPGGVTAAVILDAEDPRGEYSSLGKVDRTLKVVVSRGKGFRIESGESLAEGVAGGAPLYDLAEEAREVVRGLRFDVEDIEDSEADYKAIAPFEVQGFVLDAYEVRFSCGAQLPVQEVEE